MKEFDIRTEGKKAKIITPYNPNFVSRLKAEIGGRKRDAGAKCWVVPATAIEEVREIMRDVYGRDDAEPAGTKTVTIKYLCDIHEDRGPITAMGKIVARAKNRDSGAVVGDGVVLVEGKVKSGGSWANWTTEIEEGTILKISGVAQVWKCDWYEIVSVEDDGADIEALKAEKEKLLARIAEIDKIIGKTETAAA